MPPVPVYQLLQFLAWLQRRESRPILDLITQESVQGLALEFLKSREYSPTDGLEAVMLAFQNCHFMGEREWVRRHPLSEQIEIFLHYFKGIPFCELCDDECAYCCFLLRQDDPIRRFQRRGMDQLHPLLRGFVEDAREGELGAEFREWPREWSRRELSHWLHRLRRPLAERFEHYLRCIREREPQLIEDYERWQRCQDGDMQQRWRGLDENTKPLRLDESLHESVQRLAESVRLALESDFYDALLSRLPTGEIGRAVDFTHAMNFLASSRRHYSAAKMKVAAPPAEAVVEERAVQARVLDCSDVNSPKLLTKAFRKGAPHTVEVRVGHGDGWLTGSTPFPTDELPPDLQQYELTVAFVPLTSPLLPQVSKVILPSHGDSSACQFSFHLSSDVAVFTARVFILYESRVLQTALLDGDAVENAEITDGKGITLIVEAVVRPRFDNLDGRSEFSAALFLDHKADGTVGITELAKNRASISMQYGLAKLIKDFDKLLSAVATKKDEYLDGLQSNKLIELLRNLASYGSLLYGNVVTDQMEPEIRDSITGGDRIQIISKEADAYLPIEFIYDRAAPSSTAVLCERCQEALKTRACRESCLHAEDPDAVICPLAFWGISRVIERHMFNHATDDMEGSEDFGLSSEIDNIRQTLSVRGAVLMAATQRIEAACPGGITRLEKKVRECLNQDATAASDWSQWVQGVKDHAPSLLLLLVHTDMVADTTLQRMEIGSEQWLNVAQVNQNHVQSGKSRPLVLLLGCETGVPEIPFNGFIPQFRRGGAAIVVSAGSKIHALHVLPAVEEFLTLLANETFRGRPFGDIMREARCALLAAGYPMVLTLSAFGDADWRLED